MSRSLDLYANLLDELLWRRAVEGQLDDATEEHFAVTLNDCRRAMSSEEEQKIAEIVAKRKAIAARPSLGLVDTEPPSTADAPLRTAA